MLPKVTAVIPVYNVELYLADCLNSVINQTYSNLDIILVDDGSTDSSGKICDAYAQRDSRIRVIHQPNGGLGHARNVGMDIAIGKYIIFLDSDDFWAPETIEVLCKEAEKNDLQLLVFSGEPVWDGMEPQKGFLDYHHTVQNEIVKTGIDSFVTAKNNREYYASACMRFYLLSFLRENRFGFDEGIIHEDESFSFLSHLKAKKVEYIGNQFYKRRYRPGSIMTSRTKVKSAYGYSVAMEKVLDVYKTEDLPESTRDLFRRQIIMYMGFIFSAFSQVIRLKDDNGKPTTDAKEISCRVKRALFKARTIADYLPAQLRIATYSLYLAYWIPILKIKARQLLMKG